MKIEGNQLTRVHVRNSYSTDVDLVVSAFQFRYLLCLWEQRHCVWGLFAHLCMCMHICALCTQAEAFLTGLPLTFSLNVHIFKMQNKDIM